MHLPICLSAKSIAAPASFFFEGMLSKVASIQKGSKKIVMLMYADTFLDEETHKFVEASIIIATKIIIDNTTL